MCPRFSPRLTAYGHDRSLGSNTANWELETGNSRPENALACADGRGGV
jgi:hypothetical protein